MDVADGAGRDKQKRYSNTTEGYMAESLKVKQAIKRKFPVIDIDDSLDMAIQLMAETNVSVLAVKIGEELIGIVTVWDILGGLAHNYDRQ